MSGSWPPLLPPLTLATNASPPDRHRGCARSAPTAARWARTRSPGTTWSCVVDGTGLTCIHPAAVTSGQPGGGGSKVNVSGAVARGGESGRPSRRFPTRRLGRGCRCHRGPHTRRRSAGSREWRRGTPGGGDRLVGPARPPAGRRSVWQLDEEVHAEVIPELLDQAEEFGAFGVPSTTPARRR